MNPIPSISSTISHRRSIKHGWQHTTRIHITVGDEPLDGLAFPPDWFDKALVYWTERIDTIARAESERRNRIDGFAQTGGTE